MGGPQESRKLKRSFSALSSLLDNQKTIWQSQHLWSLLNFLHLVSNELGRPITWTGLGGLVGNHNQIQKNYQDSRHSMPLSTSRKKKNMFLKFQYTKLQLELGQKVVHNQARSRWFYSISASFSR